MKIPLSVGYALCKVFHKYPLTFEEWKDNVTLKNAYMEMASEFLENISNDKKFLGIVWDMNPHWSYHNQIAGSISKAVTYGTETFTFQKDFVIPDEASSKIKEHIRSAAKSTLDKSVMDFLNKSR